MPIVDGESPGALSDDSRLGKNWLYFSYRFGFQLFRDVPLTGAPLRTVRTGAQRPSRSSFLPIIILIFLVIMMLLDRFQKMMNYVVAYLLAFSQTISTRRAEVGPEPNPRIS